MPSKRSGKATKPVKIPKRSRITGNFSPADATTAPSHSSPQLPLSTPAAVELPDPIGVPKVWADKRQQLCETLPWFKSHQSGVQHKSSLVYGMLIDSGNGPRDELNEEIVITRVGGCRTKDEKKGKGGMSQAKHQDGTASIVKTFLNTMDKRQPVGIISGRGNPNNISKLPHFYCVLDWFFITDVWCEKDNGFRLWMVRLQKIDFHTKSWWSSVTSGPLPMSASLQQFRMTSQVCPKCDLASQQIYQQGWTCLQWNCENHFRFFAVAGDEDEIHVDVTTLGYNQAFLNKRKDWEVPIDPEFEFPTLSPPILRDEDRIRLGHFGYEQQCKNGIVCARCNGCIRRIFFDRWECENQNCNYVHRVTQQPISAAMAIASSGKGMKQICAKAIISRQLMSVGEKDYSITVYDLPGEYDQDGNPGQSIGSVYHFKANKSLNQAKGGADALFEDLQKVDLGLKRNPCSQANCVGELLTGHWAANWGAPYKFIVKQISKGFYDAPVVILDTVKNLIHAGKRATAAAPVGHQEFQGFNECLSVGYFANAKMTWHDDGEKELGPTVASVSLGGSATMQWRPKAKANIGPASKNQEGTKLAMLSIKLEHGDIMIMHGAPIQKLYEHQVIPHGTVRFALTCRYIRPETLPLASRAHSIAAGSIPVNDGDLDEDDADAAAETQKVEVVKT